MKDNKTTEYLKELGNIGLPSDAKMRMREELSSFADFHAVRITDETRSITQMQSNSVFALFRISQLRIMKATLLIALMAGLGGTSLAAQGTVPGDFLYPVKVHVNENIQSTLAVGANAEAKLQAQLLEERLEEAKKLAMEGKLQGEFAIAVQSNIAAQVDKTVGAAAEADAEVHADINATVLAELKSFNNRLATVPRNTEARMNRAMSMSLDMSQHATAKDESEVGVMSVSSFGTQLAGEITPESIVEHAQARFEALVAVTAQAAELTAQANADVQEQLNAASEFITQAHVSLKAGAQAQAEAAAQQAHEIMGEIESALSLLGSVEIDPNTGFIIDINVGGNAGGGTSENFGGAIDTDIQSNVRSVVDSPVADGPLDIQAETEAVIETVGSLGL